MPPHPPAHDTRGDDQYGVTRAFQPVDHLVVEGLGLNLPTGPIPGSSVPRATMAW